MSRMSDADIQINNLIDELTKDRGAEGAEWILKHALDRIRRQNAEAADLVIADCVAAETKRAAR